MPWQWFFHSFDWLSTMKRYCLAEPCFLTDRVQCAVGMQPEVLLSTAVWSVLGPWGVLQHSLPSGLKRKERKREKPNLLSPSKGATHVLMTDTFLKLVFVWVIMYFSIVGEMRNFTHGIWKSLWLTTFLDSNNMAINFPQQKTCNCTSHTRNNLSFSFKWMCCFKSQLFNSFI